MLHPALYVAADAVIDGNGLKTREFLPEGTVVWQLDPDEPVYRLDEIERWPVEEQHEFFRFGFQVGEFAFAYSHDIDKYTNHSCDPSTWWSIDGSMTLITRRDIQPGEEITYDYVSGDILLLFEMECSCGSSNCRHLITNRDYLDPAWQQQYGSHLPRHVLKAIAESKRNNDHVTKMGVEPYAIG
jgi:SET domain-containing protein